MHAILYKRIKKKNLTCQSLWFCIFQYESSTPTFASFVCLFAQRHDQFCKNGDICFLTVFVSDLTREYMHNRHTHSERRGAAVSTPASYSGVPVFEFPLRSTNMVYDICCSTLVASANDEIQT